MRIQSASGGHRALRIVPREGTLGIIAPASSPLKISDLEKGISFFCERGFKVKTGTTVSVEHGYLAGNDEQRVEALHTMFADKGVDAVICLRGGYGSARLLDKVDFKIIRKNAKLLVGYSDITALHMAFLAQADLPSLHGPMVAVECAKGMDQETERSLFRSLRNPYRKFSVRISAQGSDPGVHFSGIATGPLMGGNLAVLSSLVGTDYLPDFDGAILFLEETGEPVYRIDRMLNQLRLSGLLERIRGVLLGYFSDIPKQHQDRSLAEVFSDYFASLNIPVLSGFPSGHSLPNLTWLQGGIVRLNASRKVVSFTGNVA
ncbi:MAG: LD-carboxypeptidase [Chlorobi bacterium]|nr:LD-carboxypeptidase [Chlorobiota bacterium]